MKSNTKFDTRDRAGTPWKLTPPPACTPHRVQVCVLVLLILTWILSPGLWINAGSINMWPARSNSRMRFGSVSSSWQPFTSVAWLRIPRPSPHFPHAVKLSPVAARGFHMNTRGKGGSRSLTLILNISCSPSLQFQSKLYSKGWGISLYHKQLIKSKGC